VLAVASQGSLKEQLILLRLRNRNFSALNDTEILI
jgi:hypothetical protein